MLRVFAAHPGQKVVYIAPLKVGLGGEGERGQGVKESGGKVHAEGEDAVREHGKSGGGSPDVAVRLHGLLPDGHVFDHRSPHRGPGTVLVTVSRIRRACFFCLTMVRSPSPYFGIFHFLTKNSTGKSGNLRSGARRHSTPETR